MRLVCGVDLGTTNVKAAIYDADNPQSPVDGVIAASPVEMNSAGHSEADMEGVFGAVVGLLRTLLKSFAARRSIEALGISGTACGAWLVDRTGQPVRNAILWNDGRGLGPAAGGSASELLRDVYLESGNVTYPGFVLPTLRWLKENDPDAVRRSFMLLYEKDWVRYRLTGELGTEPSDASYTPFDLENQQWSKKLEMLWDVDCLHHLFPPIRPWDYAAPILPEMAAAFGLSPRLMVATGLTDIVASTIGGGGLRDSTAVVALGTSAVITAMRDETSSWGDEPALGLTARAPVGKLARSMVNTAGSTTLDWLASLLYDGDLESLLRDAEARETVKAGGLLMLPYLSRAGVVAPFIEPNATGVVAGLRSEHSRADIAAAGVAGSAFAVADALGALNASVRTLTAVGGGSRSDLLLQQIANAADVPVERADAEFAACRGVALVAARAANLYESDARFVEASCNLPAMHEFQPSGVPVEFLEYRRLADALSGFWGGNRPS